MIGARADVIAKAEEREQFKQAMEKIGLEVCRGRTVHTLAEARETLKEIGLPCVIRPSFTMGGSGSNLAYNREEFDSRRHAAGSTPRPISEVLIEESIVGWKEYEMEVMRDVDDNVVIICSIENFDPMGVHTGDSITVAPAQTLTDKEYQRMRDASLAVIREIGVETGGSNIQFAIDPDRRADDRDRDEPARQPLERAGFEGDRLSDRQDRRQAGRRLSAARIAQRHHPRDDGLLRADDRLRGDEDSAVRLRKIPRGRCPAHHADEERRRDDGDRPHVQGIVPKGTPRVGGRQLRLRLRRQGSVGHSAAAVARRHPPQAGHAQCRSRLVYPLRHEKRHDGRRDPRPDAHRPLVSRRTRADRRIGKRAAHLRRRGPRERRPAPPRQASRLFRPATGHDLDLLRNGRSAPSESAAASWPRSNRSTPAPPSSRPTRPITTRPTKTKTKRPPSRPAASGS